MKSLAKFLVRAYLVFALVAICSGIVSLACAMSAQNHGTPHPDPESGHIYAMDAQKRFSPELIVYVTKAFHLTYVISSALFFSFLVSFVALILAARFFGVNPRLSSTKNSN